MTAHSNPLAEQPDPRAAALQGGCEALRITRTSSSHGSVLLQHPHPPPSLGIAAKGKMCLAEVDASPAELSAQGLSLHTQQRKSLLETQMDTQAVSSSTELSAEMGRTPHSTHTRSHWEPSLHRSLSLTEAKGGRCLAPTKYFRAPCEHQPEAVLEVHHGAPAAPDLTRARAARTPQLAHSRDALSGADKLEHKSEVMLIFAKASTIFGAQDVERCF